MKNRRMKLEKVINNIKKYPSHVRQDIIPKILISYGQQLPQEARKKLAETFFEDYEFSTLTRLETVASVAEKGGLKNYHLMAISKIKEAERQRKQEEEEQFKKDLELQDYFGAALGAPVKEVADYIKKGVERLSIATPENYQQLVPRKTFPGYIPWYPHSYENWLEKEVENLIFIAKNLPDKFYKDLITKIQSVVSNNLSPKEIHGL